MSNDCCNHGTGKRHAETVTGLLERPLYTPGLILEDSDLTAAVDYTRELNRLLFSQLFGCGVICGLQVSVGGDCDLQVTVAPGLALDGCGDPLQVTRPVTIKLGRSDGVLPASCDEAPRIRRFWVQLCGHEKRCAPRATVCDGDGFDAVREATRARAQTEVSVSFHCPDCACGCPPLAEAEGDNFNNGQQGAAIDPCQIDHETRADCSKDCGCGGACSCGCCVLLAMVAWFEPENAWGVVHQGVRRFIRPKLLPDPIKDVRPKSNNAPPPKVPPAPEKPLEPLKKRLTVA